MTIIQTPDNNYIDNTLFFSQLFIGIGILAQIISFILFLKKNDKYSLVFDTIGNKLFIISCILLIFYGIAIIIRQLNNLWYLGEII